MEEVILNIEILNNVTNNNLKTKRMLLDKYIKITRELIDNIDANPEDYDEIMEFAHSIKGSSYQLGFIKVGNIAKDIEFVIKNGDCGRADGLIIQLKDAFDSTCLFIYSI